MEIYEKPPINPVKLILKIVLIPFLTLISAVMLNLTFGYGEHYLEIRDRAVEVEAVIVRVEESWDSDGDREYDAIMRYTVNGQDYEQKYRSFGNKYKAEDRIGTTVVTSVDPEDPQTEVHDLAVKCGIETFFSTAMMAILMATLTMRIRKPYTAYYGWSRSAAEKDLPHQIHSTYRWDVLLLPGIVMAALLIRHRQIHSWFLFAIGAIVLLAGVVVLRNYIHAMRLLRQERFTLRRDTYVSKQIRTDSDGDEHYSITFTNGKNTWEQAVDRKRYDTLGSGNIIDAVYLEGDKRPIMTRSGN